MWSELFVAAHSDASFPAIAAGPWQQVTSGMKITNKCLISNSVEWDAGYDAADSVG